MVAAPVPFGGAEAARFSTLHYFNPASGFPASPLVADGAGSFYGTTSDGGAFNRGTLFRLASDGSVTVTFDFRGGHEGANPYGPIVLVADGSVVGTALDGEPIRRPGNATGWLIYKLSPAGRETVLARFPDSGQLGKTLLSGISLGPDENLYGAMARGGEFDCGAVFRLSQSGSLQVLHDFGGAERRDGCGPQSPPAFDARGNLYGTTFGGGDDWQDGTLYRLATDGTYRILHVFSSHEGSGDGAKPSGPLLFDAKGSITGTTQTGDGLFCPGGAVYRLSPDGRERVLHGFSTYFVRGEGMTPLGGVIADANGDLYGTTFQGGTFNLGTVFAIHRDGSEKILHSFEASDGAMPVWAPTIDAQQDLLGTTIQAGYDGGTGGLGTLFKIKHR